MVVKKRKIAKESTENRSQQDQQGSEKVELVSLLTTNKIFHQITQDQTTKLLQKIKNSPENFQKILNVGPSRDQDNKIRAVICVIIGSSYEVTKSIYENLIEYDGNDYLKLVLNGVLKGLVRDLEVLLGSTWNVDHRPLDVAENYWFWVLKIFFLQTKNTTQ